MSGESSLRGSELTLGYPTALVSQTGLYCPWLFGPLQRTRLTTKEENCCTLLPCYSSRMTKEEFGISMPAALDQLTTAGFSETVGLSRSYRLTSSIWSTSLGIVLTVPKILSSPRSRSQWVPRCNQTMKLSTPNWQNQE
jgi:hypothetical protein